MHCDRIPGGLADAPSERRAFRYTTLRAAVRTFAQRGTGTGAGAWVWAWALVHGMGALTWDTRPHHTWTIAERADPMVPAMRCVPTEALAACKRAELGPANSFQRSQQRKCCSPAAHRTNSVPPPGSTIGQPPTSYSLRGVGRRRPAPSPPDNGRPRMASLGHFVSSPTANPPSNYRVIVSRTGTAQIDNRGEETKKSTSRSRPKNVAPALKRDEPQPLSVRTFLFRSHPRSLSSFARVTA